MHTTRRQFIQSAAALTLTGIVPPRLRAAATRFESDPFALGIASGYPTPAGVVLWTRLVATPERSPIDGGDPILVVWDIATDDRMRKVVQRGAEYATADFAHSVHVEVDGLRPASDYWYRFTAGGVQSQVGHTRTAPALDAANGHLRLAVASCQQYESGYFSAYRHMLDESLDLIVHTGDYIYEEESTPGGRNVRGDGSGETFSLEDYRARHALYKRDPDLRAAHAAHPWLVTWDDHEVVNDYAGDATYAGVSEQFLLRRAAAYRAYYEHMPLPRSALPRGPHMPLYTSSHHGNLVQIHMLDSRQYRSPLACLDASDGDGAGARCAELFAATRTKLGAQQEQWLRAELGVKRANWNIFAQGTPMAHADRDPGPGTAYRRDAWDGYPAARQRFLDTLLDTRTRNPVLVDGDIHAFQVANINRQANDLATPVIASEFTTTSITSRGISQARLDRNRSGNPNLLLADSSRRGYLLLDINPKRLRAELVSVDTVAQADSVRGVMATFVVETDQPGPVRA